MPPYALKIKSVIFLSFKENKKLKGPPEAIAIGTAIQPSYNLE